MGFPLLPKEKGSSALSFDRGAHKVVLCLRKTRFLRLKVPQGVDKIMRRRFTHQGFREIFLPQRKLREKEAAQRRANALRAKQGRQIRAAGLPSTRSKFRFSAKVESSDTRGMPSSAASAFPGKKSSS